MGYGIHKGMRVEHTVFPPITGTVCVVQDILNSDRRIGVMNDATNTIYYDSEITWVEILDDDIIDVEYREVT